MSMDLRRNAPPQKHEAKQERTMCAEKQKGWRSTFSLLLLLLVGVPFMGGCSGGGGEQVLSTVSGLVSTFSGYAAGGKVELRTLNGEPLTGGAGEVLSTGLFEIMPPDPLPASFLVVVTEATEASVDGEPAAADAPPTLQALVENNRDGALSTRVTPLSSLVAQYALSTGKSLEESDAAIAAFLELEPGVSPSLLEPPLLDTSDFAFKIFGASWAASGLFFDVFLDDLVRNSLSGETMTFANPEEDQFFISIFLWVLNKVVDAAVSTGVGSISSLITGNGEWDAVQKQMAEISQSLDKIYNELVTFETDINDLLRQMSMESDYNTMLPAISSIRSHYDDLQRLAKYKDRDRAKVLAERLDADFSSSVKPGLDTINEKLTAPIVGTTFYQKLGEYLLGRVTSKRMTGDQALLQYRRAFVFLTGIQIRGLILASESTHLSKNPEDVKRETLAWHKTHLERISAQAKCFLDGAEKLVVFGFPYAGCTLNYHTITEDGDSPYQPIDSVAADAVGVERQIVTRLLWDPRVPTQYPWTDNPPLDYGDYFPFMKERMAKLGEGKTLSLRLVREGDQKKAVNEYGTINSMTYRNAGEREIQAVVLRHIFILGDSPISNIPWVPMVDSNAAKIFDLSEEEANRFPGTVGRQLLNSSGSYDERIGFCLHLGNDRPSYATASFFAWLPDQFLLRNGKPVARKIPADSPANRNAPHHKYKIKSRYFNFIVKRLNDQTYEPGLGGDENSAVLHALIRYEPSNPESADLRYGDVIVLSGRIYDGKDTFWTMLSLPNRTSDSAYYNEFKKDPGENELLVVKSLPFVMGAFVNPEKSSVYPREYYPILLQKRSTGNFMQELEGKRISCFDNTKNTGVFWYFYPTE